MNQKRFGQNLRIYRIKNALSQKELSVSTGLSVSHISHLENGTARVSIDSLLSLCHALGVSPGRLLLGCSGKESSDK